MKNYTMLDCQIEVDEEKTKQWYANAKEWGCECGDCINFLEVARRGELPDIVNHYLSVFGIPPTKATYVCRLPSFERVYQFSYRICGNIVKNHSSPIVGDVHFCYETYPYGAPEFPEPHFDIEFFVELPWVLDEPDA